MEHTALSRLCPPPEPQSSGWCCSHGQGRQLSSVNPCRRVWLQTEAELGLSCCSLPLLAANPLPARLAFCICCFWCLQTNAAGGSCRKCGLTNKTGVSKAFHPHLLPNSPSHYPALSPNLLSWRSLPKVWLSCCCSNISVSPELCDVCSDPGDAGASSRAVIVLFTAHTSCFLCAR